jgi:6-pyruvoyl-tetrahydropterin synthase
MDPQRWTDLARVEDELKNLRNMFSLASQQADHSATYRLNVAITGAVRERDDMVCNITDLLAADG